MRRHLFAKSAAKSFVILFVTQLPLADIYTRKKLGLHLLGRSNHEQIFWSGTVITCGMGGMSGIYDTACF